MPAHASYSHGERSLYIRLRWEGKYAFLLLERVCKC